MTRARAPRQVGWLRKLLRSPHTPFARPRWWNRLTIDLGGHQNLNAPEEAWAACADALADPWLADRTAPEYGQVTCKGRDVARIYGHPRWGRQQMTRR